MDVSHSSLVATLGALLPVATWGTVRGATYVTRGDGATGAEGMPSHVVLPNGPTALLVVTQSDGAAVTEYRVDYSSGRVEFATVAVGTRVLISYQVDLADELIRQAVNDLGRRLPRRQVGAVWMDGNEGLLPADLTTLISVSDQLCCGAAVRVGGCELFVSGGSWWPVAGCVRGSIRSVIWAAIHARVAAMPG